MWSFLATALLLQGESDAPPAADGGGSSHFAQLFLPLILIFFIFWLLVFRPESKKRKEREAKVRAMRKGDQVVTTGGIIGKVTKVEDRSVVVQVDKDKDVRLRFAKTSIFEVTPPDGDASGGAPEGGRPLNS